MDSSQAKTDFFITLTTFEQLTMLRSVLTRTALRTGVLLRPVAATSSITHPPVLQKYSPTLLAAFRHQSSTGATKVPIGKVDKPQYQLTFTCKKCDTRSSHALSKQAYHKGTVLIQCPGCKNRHLIADHLKVRTMDFVLYIQRL